MIRLTKQVFILLLCSATCVFALTKDEVKAHVLKGKTYCEKVGISKCIEEFDKKEGLFQKGELYIWANDFDGLITAHPIKPLKGKNLYRYKDILGNQLFKNFIDKVKINGQGWVDYIWSHPITKKQTPKSSFVISIGENQLIGAGYYIE